MMKLLDWLIIPRAAHIQREFFFALELHHNSVEREREREREKPQLGPHCLFSAWKILDFTGFITRRLVDQIIL